MRSFPIIAGLSCSLAVGCFEPAGAARPNDARDSNMGDIEAPVCEPAASSVGTYESAAQWKITGPIHPDRSMGDIIADLVIAEVVGTLGLPGSLAGKAEDSLQSMVHDKLADAIDSTDVAANIRESDYYTAIENAAANLDVESTLAITEDNGNRVAGTETFHRIAITGTDYAVDTSSIPLVATWSGSRDGTLIDVEPHGLVLAYGDVLVSYAGDTLSTEAGMLEAIVVDTVCDAAVQAIAGADAKLTFGFDVSFVSYDYSVGTNTLRHACEAAAGLVIDEVTDMFDIDTPIIVGGSVVVNSACDGTVTGLSSDSFGGFIDIAPKPIAPQLLATFSATRL